MLDYAGPLYVLTARFHKGVEVPGKSKMSSSTDSLLSALAATTLPVSTAHVRLPIGTHLSSNCHAPLSRDPHKFVTV